MLKMVSPKSSVDSNATGARLPPTRNSFCSRDVAVQRQAPTKNFVVASVKTSGSLVDGVEVGPIVHVGQARERALELVRGAQVVVEAARRCSCAS